MYEMSVCMCAKQQTNDLYIIICNCIYIVVIDCGWNNNVTEGILSALSKSVCGSANLVSSVKVNISNNNRGPRQCTLCTLHMHLTYAGKIRISPVIVKKQANRLHR